MNLSASFVLALRSLGEGAKSVVVFFQGKKTYIVATATILYSLGIKRNWWGSDVEIWGLLGSSAAVTVRLAITRMMKQFLDDFTTASAVPPPK
jgi:hypothetical protein